MGNHATGLGAGQSLRMMQAAPRALSRLRISASLNRSSQCALRTGLQTRVTGGNVRAGVIRRRAFLEKRCFALILRRVANDEPRSETSCVLVSLLGVAGGIRQWASAFHLPEEEREDEHGEDEGGDEREGVVPLEEEGDEGYGDAADGGGDEEQEAEGDEGLAAACADASEYVVEGMRDDAAGDGDL